MGQRSRKRGRRDRTPDPLTSAAPATGGPPEPPVSRTEARNAAVRATLTPFEAAERPWPVWVSASVALVLGAVNLGLFIGGAKPNVGGQQPHLAEVAIFSGLMLMCAVGMLRMRYWAVLGFQTLLAIGLLGFSLALIRASSVLGALICLAVVIPGGYLFYKLVRVLGRMQLPAPPRR